MRILDLDTRIAPFGDRAADLPICDLPLLGVRAREVEASGVKPERLTFADYAFATAPILVAFSKAASGPSVLAIKEGSPIASFAPVSSARREGGLVLYDIFIDATGRTLEELRAEARPVIVDWPSVVRAKELPRLGPGPWQQLVPADGAFALHLEHWVHFLWAGPAYLPRLLRGKKNLRLGKKISIHPKAYVEGSVIGEGTEIGAKAFVRHSYVGPGSRISDFTKLGHVALGQETHTLVDANLTESVAFGGGTLASLQLKESILGKNAFVTTGVIFWTDVLEGTVSVEHRGRWVDSERRQLGGCAGHGVILGARTIVAPGRALPNGITVVMRKEEGVFKVEAAAPGTPMCWDDAALVPVDRLVPGHRPEEIG